ncbi:MAG: hypothetical protein ACREH8_22480 [Opitutaceae bacterium]
MINSTSSSHRAPQLDRVALSGPPSTRPSQTRSDRISAEGVAFLRAELLRQPEIRPEVLERARALVADPDYPGASINRSLAQLMLEAPDHSEDQV